MTFINARILRKRPNLFVTPKRNYGNLLIKYETGQDTTTEPEPDPEPEPQPVTFSTSWSTSGGIVEANLTSISLHRTTEVIALTRSDGTVLATLDENKVGDWDLQYDEGTSYGTYSYEIRLDGVVQSSFTRTYEPDTPTFTTNFFSPSAKTISCGVENITNPGGLFIVQLARLDGTVLDSRVLNDGTSFFLSYTEGDYGSYEYQILLNDAQVATHSQTFPRPEPTFTTSWTKSGLSITADLSSITNAHPEFYAYLTRDDGTVLATHQFQTGETTTSLTFTEADYGTFNYQLKLGETVVSSHTETYVRPEPTFTTIWAKSGLSITADLSSIAGAHPEFYAYLTRDEGTVLATHQFTEGQTTTSLTFTEADYGTFTYQLKLGTSVVSSHTETYVRPTPTYTTSFSTNELTLTASITNITNAHSSFAITLERDDGTVLQTHTLADGETSFTFTQTETSYGSYNYVVKLNGTQTDNYSATYNPPPYIHMRLRHNYTNPTFYLDRYNFNPTNDPLAIYYRHTIENPYQVGNVAQNYYNNITTLSQFQALGGVTQINNVTSDWSSSMSVSSTRFGDGTQQMTWFFIVHSSRSVAYRIAIWYYTSTNDTDARNAYGKTATYTNMNEIDM